MFNIQNVSYSIDINVIGIAINVKVILFLEYLSNIIIIFLFFRNQANIFKNN
jgi:hypothetical protein